MQTSPELTALLVGRQQQERLEHAAQQRLRSRPGTSPLDRLSAREREVLALVAAGCSNREIAGALSISYRTAAKHVEHIFTKLDVSSRWHAALLALGRLDA
jgi:DNA-binding NarL/FixJ family response regulator